jgi:O-methyltransferase
VDKYIPTLAGLEVFYPKMSPGGFIFIHDFHNPESNFGVSKAVNEWCEKNQVLYFELPDANGTVIIRRPLS